MELKATVLIVAKCIVNPLVHVTGLDIPEVLIVAKCIVNQTGSLHLSRCQKY